MAKSQRPVVMDNLSSSDITCYYHTYTTYFGIISDIIKGDRVNNKGRFTLEILDTKFWVTISRCCINKGDIFEIRV